MILTERLKIMSREDRGCGAGQPRNYKPLSVLPCQGKISPLPLGLELGQGFPTPEESLVRVLPRPVYREESFPRRLRRLPPPQILKRRRYLQAAGQGKGSSACEKFRGWGKYEVRDA